MLMMQTHPGPSRSRGSEVQVPGASADLGSETTLLKTLNHLLQFSQWDQTLKQHGARRWIQSGSWFCGQNLDDV